MFCFCRLLLWTCTVRLRIMSSFLMIYYFSFWTELSSAIFSNLSFVRYSFSLLISSWPPANYYTNDRRIGSCGRYIYWFSIKLGILFLLGSLHHALNLGLIWMLLSIGWVVSCCWLLPSTIQALLQRWLTALIEVIQYSWLTLIFIYSKPRIILSNSLIFILFSFLYYFQNEAELFC